MSGLADLQIGVLFMGIMVASYSYCSYVGACIFSGKHAGRPNENMLYGNKESVWLYRILKNKSKSRTSTHSEVARSDEQNGLATAIAYYM